MTFHELANHVCAELPEGYDITIALENGAGSVGLFEPDGFELVPDQFCSPDDSLEDKVLQALEFAKKCVA